jgi:hypothetical protein
VKREEDKDYYIQNRLSMEAQSPIRLFIFCKKEIAGEDFDTEENY